MAEEEETPTDVPVGEAEEPAATEEEVPDAGAEAAPKETEAPRSSQASRAPKKPKEKPQKEDRSPPNEKIFLLELVVDNINFDFCTMKRLDTVEGQLCVSYTFLKNGPFEINECDFVTKKTYSDGCESSLGIRNGKSCLFALTKKQIEEVKQDFVLEIEILKIPEGGSHAIMKNIKIGHMPINLVLLFENLMQAVEATNSTVFAKSLKDCFKIFKYENDEIAGHLGLFIRLSCFGRLIVNNFQMNLQQRRVAIKANQGHYTFKYNKKLIEPTLEDSSTTQSKPPPIISCPCKPSCPLPVCDCPPPRPLCPAPSPRSKLQSDPPGSSCQPCKIDEILQTDEVRRASVSASKPKDNKKKGKKKK